MMRKKKASIFLIGCALLGVAIACDIIPKLAAAPVRVGPLDSHAEKWEKIGDALEAAYGDSFRDAEIEQVGVPVVVTLLGVTSVGDIFFLKDCGKTLKEKASEIGGSNSGGGGGGSGYVWVPGGSFLPPPGYAYGCTGIADVGEIEQP